MLAALLPQLFMCLCSWLLCHCFIDCLTVMTWVVVWNMWSSISDSLVCRSGCLVAWIDEYCRDCLWSRVGGRRRPTVYAVHKVKILDSFLLHLSVLYMFSSTVTSPWRSWGVWLTQWPQELLLVGSPVWQRIKARQVESQIYCLVGRNGTGVG